MTQIVVDNKADRFLVISFRTCDWPNEKINFRHVKALIESFDDVKKFITKIRSTLFYVTVSVFSKYCPSTRDHMNNLYTRSIDIDNFPAATSIFGYAFLTTVD